MNQKVVQLTTSTPLTRVNIQTLWFSTTKMTIVICFCTVCRTPKLHQNVVDNVSSMSTRDEKKSPFFHFESIPFFCFVCC